VNAAKYLDAVRQRMARQAVSATPQAADRTALPADQRPAAHAKGGGNAAAQVEDQRLAVAAGAG
jgi:hypothetical protein